MCQNPADRVEGSYIRQPLPVLERHQLINLRRLHELLHKHGLEALVCRGGVNVSYLSGLASPGTLGRHLDLADTPREAFVVWPSDGDPVVIVSEIASQLAQTTTWVDDVRAYRDYVETPEHALVTVLSERGLARARIGFDVGWFGARRWEELRRLLPSVTYVDVTDGLDLVRAIKTPAEIERLRTAARLLDRTFTEVFASARAGDSERDLHARVTRRAIELGAESIHGILQASSNRVLYAGESDNRLVHGDIVRTDYVAYVDGYAANLSRILSVGRPSPDLRARYTRYLEIYGEAVGLLRPGITGSELHSSIQRLFTSRQWEPGPPISGHGIGVWFHQQRPLLVPESVDVLEAGMVVALEPISGHWHLQDEYLIGEASPIRISDGFPLEDLPWAG